MMIFPLQLQPGAAPHRTVSDVSRGGPSSLAEVSVLLARMDFSLLFGVRIVIGCMP
jgi:hypothetical protein